MNYKIVNTDILKLKCDVLVLAMYEGQKLTGNLKDIDEKLGGALESRINNRNFTGSFGKSLTIDTLGKLKADTVMIKGLGKKKDFTAERMFRAGAQVAKSLDESIQTVVVDFQLKSKKHQLSNLFEGIAFGEYRFNKYKTSKTAKREIEYSIAVKNPGSTIFKSESRNSLYVSEAQKNSRDIVNEPPGYLTPAKLSEFAVNIAEKGNLEVEIFDRDRMEELKMGGILAVTRGSGQPPKFIHLIYTPENGKPGKEVALVGKGVTFDSGGLNLKPGDSMRTMKMDMGGAATVLGIMQAVSHLKPDVRIHGIVPAAENMTGGLAYKPDDIIYAMNGKSIEIINTDAEGRLLLADALSYCAGIKPDEIIDFATLTGSCIVALGHTTAGIMGNDQDFIEEIRKCAEETGEKMWQLPMDEDIARELESDVADIKNAGSRWGGAIYAAHFLKNFVPEKTRWSHIDLAGPAFIMKGNEFSISGGTGFGIRTVLNYLTRG